MLYVLEDQTLLLELFVRLHSNEGLECTLNCLANCVTKEERTGFRKHASPCSLQQMLYVERNAN